MLSQSVLAIQSIFILFSLLRSVLTTPIDTTPASPLQDRGYLYTNWSPKNPYRVFCYYRPPPKVSLILSDPPIKYESTSDLCFSNANANAGCHCERFDSPPVVNQRLVCNAAHFRNADTINAYCKSACACFYGGPVDGFDRSPDWFNGSACTQKFVDDDGRRSLQAPIYCMYDEDCGDGCFCNGRQDQFYVSGQTAPRAAGMFKQGVAYTQLKLVLGAGLPDQLGVCGEKFRPSGTDGGIPYGVDQGENG